MFEGEAAVVDNQHLTQIAELSCGLDTSTGNMRFNYNEGRVECELLTKRENSNIVIQGTTNSDLVKLENPVEIASTNLKSALSIFSQETTLLVRVSPDGISLESGNIKAAVIGKNVGK